MIICCLDNLNAAIPEERRTEILQEAHNNLQAGHLGVEKTYQRIAARYYWPGMYRTAVEYDLFTKWIECTPLRRATGPKIAEALEALIFSRWGTPDVLLTDNGTEFANKSSRELAEQNHRDWDLNLPQFRFAYNTAHHSVLQASPALLNFGREPRPAKCVKASVEPPVDLEVTSNNTWNKRVAHLLSLRHWILENHEHAYKRQAHHYNLRRRDKAVVGTDDTPQAYSTLLHDNL
ncbi:uncharacterized protein LOC143211062 [Lasioglossum baleicum]|uniref:uncharacterized protein LOC143211062 n=1 Tax=Lasioglossum baleicum TaxID=434251 RepID=UPI003FCE104A